jgi:hypothetical protein
MTAFFCAGDLSLAKILVVGHDPRLNKSDTLAERTFFADYFFKQIPAQRSELAKYRLAAAVFSYISHLTSYRYSASQIVLTNLCNSSLPHAPKGKTVYIPEAEAKKGIQTIQSIFSQADIELIFLMSNQVNYWLQKLGFYPAVRDYILGAEPKTKGVTHKDPYYDPKRSRAFTEICGKQYRTVDGRKIIPILHVKNWPLPAKLVPAYRKAYDTCISALK